MSSKPVFIFLPGAWHSPYCYEPLIAELAKLGYESDTISLNINSDTPLESMEPDVEAVISKLAPLMDG